MKTDDYRLTMLKLWDVMIILLTACENSPNFSSDDRLTTNFQTDKPKLVTLYCLRLNCELPRSTEIEIAMQTLGKSCKVAG